MSQYDFGILKIRHLGGYERSDGYVNIKATLESLYLCSTRLSLVAGLDERGKGESFLVDPDGFKNALEAMTASARLAGPFAPASLVLLSERDDRR